MNKKIKTLEELKDSKILFEKNVPPFGYIIILTVSVLLIGVIIWSVFAPKVYMIRALGTVTSENVNYVMSSVGGTVIDSKMQEGLFVKEGEVLFCVKSSEYNVQSKQLNDNLTVYKDRIEQYRKLIKSIKDDKNYFDSSSYEDDLYYTAFEAYKSQIKQNQFDASTYKNYGYSDEQIAVEIEKSQAKTSEIYYSAIQNAENSIADCELQIASINAQLAALQSGKEEYQIVASASGTLHLLTDYKNGMVVQAGAAIAVIAPENEDAIIEAYVSPADRARMNDNDRVEIAVSGLTQSVYGKISGRVIQIDSNSTVREGENGENNSAFKVKIRPDCNYLTSKSGNKINLSNGMAVEARIQYDQVTYFNYVIEKLGFLVR